MEAIRKLSKLFKLRKKKRYQRFEERGTQNTLVLVLQREQMAGQFCRLLAHPDWQSNSCYRWLKFEEDVEDGGERWSKPYVATLSLHSLFELRSCIINSTVLLDMRASSIEEIAGNSAVMRPQQEQVVELPLLLS